MPVYHSITVTFLTKRHHLHTERERKPLRVNEHEKQIRRSTIQIRSGSWFSFRKLILQLLSFHTTQSLMKLKVKSYLCLIKQHVIKTYCGNGRIAPRILNFGMRWIRVDRDLE